MAAVDATKFKTTNLSEFLIVFYNYYPISPVKENKVKMSSWQILLNFLPSQSPNLLFFGYAIMLKQLFSL